MGEWETHVRYYLIGIIKSCLVGVMKTFCPSTEDVFIPSVGCLIVLCVRNSLVHCPPFLLPSMALSQVSIRGHALLNWF